MSATKISVEAGKHNVQIQGPRSVRGALALSVPEFHAKDESGPFAIREVLAVEQADPGTRVRFSLAGGASELGIEFKGSVFAEGSEARIQAKVRNLRTEAIHNGHHTVLLDLSEADAFEDRTGERTFLYAETGWASVAHLLDPIHSHRHTVHVGASHNGVTVMWKMIARFDESRRTIVALALDKGYVFGSDHPDWGRSLLGGYRWATIMPQETKSMLGKVYLFLGTLDELRLRYIKDFK